MNLFFGPSEGESKMAGILLGRIEDADLVRIVKVAKNIDDNLGTNVESEVKRKIRGYYGEFDGDSKFDCKKVGFHIWNFKKPVTTVDTLKELELTLECVHCVKTIALRGTTEPCKGD